MGKKKRESDQNNSHFYRQSETESFRAAVHFPQLFVVPDVSNAHSFKKIVLIYVYRVCSCVLEYRCFRIYVFKHINERLYSTFVDIHMHKSSANIITRHIKTKSSHGLHYQSVHCQYLVYSYVVWV